MSVIWYNSIADIAISLTDPNTWGAVSTVPWVSSPKIDWSTSIYNMPSWAEWIAWWSTNVTWSATDYNTVAWSSWSVYLPDWTVLSVTAWNTWNMSGVTYIYYDQDTSTVVSTTTAQDAVWKWKVLLCAASPSESGKDAQFQAFWTNAQSTFITADNIAANTIAANELIWNTITWRTIEWCTLRAYYSTDEIKMWTDWTQPKIQFKDNWSIVWYIAWISVDGTSCLAVWNTNWYVGLVWKIFCSGRFKLPVGNDLYFSS